MATYPNVNAANQYARDIVGGKILACQSTRAFSSGVSNGGGE